MIILQIKDSAVKAGTIAQTSSIVHNYWFWISAIEGIVILILISKLYRKQKNLKFDESILSDSKKTEVDIKNVLDSMYQSKALYDKLKVKCHPDRFTNAELNKIADDLQKEITQNQRNYKKLLELKTKAEEQLNIKF